MTITIDGKKYDLTQEGIFRELSEKHDSEWWADIVSFLQEWMNDKPDVELQTSGSTGKPKKFRALKSKMWISATKTCDFFQLSEKSTALLCLSAKYIAGKMMIVRAMVSGMNLICTEPVSNPLTSVEQEIDFTAMVPLQVDTILRKNDKALNIIKFLIIGGAQVSNSLSKKLKSYSGYAYETFGMTETLSHIALKQLTPQEQDYFVPFNGVFISQGFDNVMIIDFPELGIYKMKTNDIIEFVNNEGFFRWLGRKDFVINTGGVKIYPESVERKISDLLDVNYCISKLSNERLGEELVLVIEGEPFDTTQLTAKIDKILSKYEQPRGVIFTDKLPTTPGGKIDRQRVILA